MKNLKNIVIISLFVVALGTLFVMCAPSTGSVCSHIKEVVSTDDWWNVFGGMEECKKEAAKLSDDEKKCIMSAGSYLDIIDCIN